MNKKVKVVKTIIVIIAVLLMIGMTIYMMPIMKSLLTDEGKLAYANKVESSGINGLFMIVGLEVAQIFLMFLPGEPIEVIAGICYGKVWGTIIIMVSAMLISILIYLLVKKFGKSFIYSFCNEKQIEKLENSKMFKNEKKIELIMLILFLIPGMPKDLLVYLAGVLPIKPVRFIVISSIARFPSVFSSTFAGEMLTKGNIGSIILAYVVTFLLVGIISFIIIKLDKKRDPKDAIEIEKVI